MADEKYGRLFTEADAIEMLRVCLTMQPHGPQGDVARRIAEKSVREWPGGTFLADEPLFLLRGQDLAAHGGAWGYAYEAQRVGASIEFVTAALGRANDLRDWALEHRDRMKVPE